MSCDVISPVDKSVVATLEETGLEDADCAIDRAARAQERWAAVSPGDRARLLRRAAAAVDAAREELAALEVRNAGHTITNVRLEALNVSEVLAYFAGAPERHCGRQIPVSGGVDLTFYEPIGVVGVIVPWNFPMPIAS